MSQPEQTKSTNQKRRNRNRNKNKFGGSRMEFLAGKTSAIPLPIQEVDEKLSIIKWGKDNLYPYYLNYLSRANAMHGGILRAKQNYIVAGGMVYDGADTEAYEKFYNNNKTAYGDKDLLEVITDTALNYEKSNLFCYEVRLSPMGKGVRRIVEIPFEKIRFEVRKEGEKITFTGNIKLSEDWTNDKLTARTLKPYDPLNKKQLSFYILHKEESGQSLDETKSKKINPGIYPDPPYGAGIVSIDTGIEIAKTGNAETHNFFSLGTIISLNNGMPKNEEDKNKTEKDIRAAGTGANNTGGIWITYSNGKDRGPSILPLNGNDLPDRYINAKKGSEESIIHAHSVVGPGLFGVRQEGSFNASELADAYVIMESNYFERRRKSLLNVINWIGQKFAGLQGTISFGEKVLEFPSNKQQPQFVVNVGDKKDEKQPEKKEALSKEDSEKILERLKQHGRPKGDIMELYSMSINSSKTEDPKALLDEFYKNNFSKLTDKPMQVLNLINEGQDFNSIRKAMDISGPELAGIYKRLQELKMISSEGKVLKAGATELANADIEKMEILYEYALRPGFKDEIIPGTRDFCRTLINLNRVYTRDEINQISGVEGYDVFAYRGGWYHNPKTDMNEPGCRHEWKQVVVFKK